MGVDVGVGIRQGLKKKNIYIYICLELFIKCSNNYARSDWSNWVLYISTYASAVRHARALWNCHERRHVTSVRVQISRHKQGVSPVLGIRKDAKVLLRIVRTLKYN